MHVVKSTQRWQQLFQSLVTMKWSATVLEHVLVPSDTLAAALGPWGQAAECWGQAGSGCSPCPAVLQLPPPARRAVDEEGGLHGDALCALPLGRAGCPPTDPVAHFAPGSAAWAGVPFLHLGGDLAAEGEFHPALEESVWMWALWPGKSFFPFPPSLRCCCLGQSRREEKNQLLMPTRFFPVKVILSDSPQWA